MEKIKKMEFQEIKYILSVSEITKGVSAEESYYKGSLQECP